MKNKIIALMLSLVCVSAHAQWEGNDVVSTSSSVPGAIHAFNEEIRKTTRRMIALEGGLNLSGTGVTGVLRMANGGTGSALTDPGADRILFWDDSAGEVTWLTVGGGLGVSGTTLSGLSAQIFTSSGSFVAPSGVTLVFITAVGAGGGGTGGVTNTNGGGGGGSGAIIINYPYTVVPGNTYTVTINAGGTAGLDGGSTVFDALTIPGGKGATSVAGGLSGSYLSNNTPVIGIGNNGANGEAGTGSRYGGAGGGTIFGTGGAGGTSGSDGSNAAANTGGGGGGGSSTGASAGVGGSGASGVLMVNY